MKSALKYLAILSLTVSLALFTAGCGKKDNASVPDPDAWEQKDYVPEYTDMGNDLIDMTFHYGIQQLGEELCYLSYDSDSGQALEKYSLTDGSRTSVPFTWLEPEVRQNISRFTFAEDGGLYAVVWQYPESDSDGGNQAVILLSKFDAQGNQSFAVDISEQVREEFGGGVNNMPAADAWGRIYITGKTKVWLYDLQENGEPSYRGQVAVCPGGEEDVNIGAIQCGRDGRMYVCYSRGERLSDASCTLVQIDFENCRLGAVYEDFPGAGGIAPGTEKDFLVNDTETVYEYDLVSGNAEPVLNWMENNVLGSEVRHFGALKDGRIYAVTKEWGNENSGLMVFQRMTGDGPTDPREEITLANLFYNGELQKAVADFNKRSDQYRIVIKEYKEYQTLLLDITTNCPDILDLNSLNVEQLAGMGVFADLNGYLDNSSVLERSDYLENVLDAYTFDGKLVTVPSTFSIQTVIGNAESLREVFGDDFEGGWTVDELMTYANAYPETELFDRLSKSTVMYYLMMYGKDSFIDWEAGKCSFQSDRFKNVLEFVKRFPDEAALNSASTAARLESGEVLLAAASVYRFDSLQLYEEAFHGEAACVGFPTADGSVGCALYTNNALAIAANSAHKEGAWSFIEGFLADKAENGDSDDFVTNRTRLEKNVASALAAEYAVYDDGTLVVDKEGNHIVTNYVGSTITFADGWTFVSHPPTEEEVQKVFSLIGKAVRRPDRESDILLNIINEEADAFYQDQKSADEVADLIQNRIQLYLDENRS
ncbi:MAG: extracellular solute-binding protein [Roseburia sp.]|nr:extracellular solute-binding protein [Roseburia sp.]MCM1097666.1 extracellular solute-binding protein [Ruminococcus flavefaciens]